MENAALLTTLQVMDGLRGSCGMAGLFQPFAQNYGSLPEADDVGTDPVRWIGWIDVNDGKRKAESATSVWDRFDRRGSSQDRATATTRISSGLSASRGTSRYSAKRAWGYERRRFNQREIKLGCSLNARGRRLPAVYWEAGSGDGGSSEEGWRRSIHVAPAKVDDGKTSRMFALRGGFFIGLEKLERGPGVRVQAEWRRDRATMGDLETDGAPACRREARLHALEKVGAEVVRRPRRCHMADCSGARRTADWIASDDAD